MNKKYTIPARFDPGNSFEVSILPAALTRQTQEFELERLKNRLVEEALEASVIADEPSAERAGAEAAALAWTTPFPLLLLPVLFQEKLESVRARRFRQEQIRQRSEMFLEGVL
jgi:hypothetical protein